MAKLVDQSIDYIKQHLFEVVRLPIDMNCINSKLLKKIAAKIQVKIRLSWNSNPI
jgi:hypothetical protein